MAHRFKVAAKNDNPGKSALRLRILLGLVAVIAVFVFVTCWDDGSDGASTAAIAADSTPTTTRQVAEAPTSTEATTTTVATTTSTEATAPTTSTTTTSTTSTTTTTRATTTTTSPPPTTTTTTAPSEPSGNQPPAASITSPANLSSHPASFDPGAGLFGAAITFTADATDPNGDPITIEWFSSDEGLLGTGANLTATIHTGGSDSSQPFITVRVTDQWGRVTDDQIQIIVWIPSS